MKRVLSLLMVVLLLGLTACGTTEESPKHTLEFIEGRKWKIHGYLSCSNLYWKRYGGRSLK